MDTEVNETIAKPEEQELADIEVPVDDIEVTDEQTDLVKGGATRAVTPGIRTTGGS